MLAYGGRRPLADCTKLVYHDKVTRHFDSQCSACEHFGFADPHAFTSLQSLPASRASRASEPHDPTDHPLSQLLARLYPLSGVSRARSCRFDSLRSSGTRARDVFVRFDATLQIVERVGLLECLVVCAVEPIDRPSPAGSTSRATTACSTGVSWSIVASGCTFELFAAACSRMLATLDDIGDSTAGGRRHRRGAAALGARGPGRMDILQTRRDCSNDRARVPTSFVCSFGFVLCGGGASYYHSPSHTENAAVVYCTNERHTGHRSSGHGRLTSHP